MARSSRQVALGILIACSQVGVAAVDREPVAELGTQAEFDSASCGASHVVVRVDSD